jgi:hypothetical protein
VTEIVINHLTRMKAPRICIAGLDPRTKRHIRPVTGRDRFIGRSLLQSEGGVCEVGVKVELGSLVPRPSPPEIEDHIFEPGRIAATAKLRPEEYLSLIDEACVDDLHEVFGSALERSGRTYSVTEGCGDASLGCVRLKPDRTTELFIDGYGNVKLRLRGPGGASYIKVNDLRCYEKDQNTPSRSVVEAVQGRLAKGVPLRVMVGLTRAYPPKGEKEKKHWLQVNGLCLEDAPLGVIP